ncbi:hypothetical protein VTO42DRAFT_5182 [Malbranchea cinnamomea]
MLAELSKGTLANESDFPIMDVRLKELVMLASEKEAVKDYETAADLYSQATELQASINGDMAVSNADLLYLYGKCLYHVAINKSDVLGSKIPTGALAELKGDIKSNRRNRELSGEPSAENTSEECSDSNDAPESAQNPPFFQFNGDEDFDDTDEYSSGAEEQELNDEDDFANAFEILDLARILFLRRLDECTATKCEIEDDKILAGSIRKVKERLADTYNLQAEILLESEKFLDAVTDLKAALNLNQELYAFEDPIIAECHYKISLALEFSSISKHEVAGSPRNESRLAKVDTALRKEAEDHMGLAIQSCKLRILKEEEKLKSDEIDDAVKQRLKKTINDVKNIVSDMELRLAELRHPPPLLDLSEESSQSYMRENVSSVWDGFANKANDLTSLVRKKKLLAETAVSNVQETMSSSKKHHLESSSSEDQQRDKKRGKL